MRGRFEICRVRYIGYIPLARQRSHGSTTGQPSTCSPLCVQDDKKPDQGAHSLASVTPPVKVAGMI